MDPFDVEHPPQPVVLPDYLLPVTELPAYTAVTDLREFTDITEKPLKDGKVTLMEFGDNFFILKTVGFQTIANPLADEEYEIQRHLRFHSHLNIIQPILIQVEAARSITKIVYPYAPEGSLFGVQIPNEGTLAILAEQLLRAVRHLHAQGILHLSIQPRHLLVYRTGRLVVTGLGVGRLVRTAMRPVSPQHILVKARVRYGGAPFNIGARYLAPEYIRAAIERRDVYANADENAPAADMWAVGITLWELFVGNYPFDGVDFSNPDLPTIYNAIVAAAVPDFLTRASREFRQFLQCCLQIRPAERRTANQLLRHPFITGIFGRPVRRR
ncbi:mitogen-activated protein kinase kinase 5-like [Ipomoea triloba]|uniref:mitogen-activated protein kinase kinase 5-like n=1 Tax=Ipomoea triloba TaxID=35885 RepID=UPI00125E864F|nr:mitogen-activated protein kinase kinase 5-like [Ipomoea triloba]XP_031092950.1 mitogen-activated protein kinase kinase 5-like [Ipomoea triloba]